MANLTITVPNGDVLDTLVLVATETLLARAKTQAERDAVNAMPAADKGKAYIALILRDIYINRKRAAAETAAKAASVDPTVATATTTASGIV